MGKRIIEAIDVSVPASEAFAAWTRVKEFPRFMRSVHTVDVRDDRTSHWQVVVAGVTRQFDAEITQLIPGRRLAWRSLNGPWQSGIVGFRQIGPRRTRVTVEIETEPHGVAEKVGDALGLTAHQVRRELEHFRNHLEQREVTEPAPVDLNRMMTPWA